MKRNRHSFFWGLFIILIVYGIMLFILIHSESTSDASEIHSLSDAFWFSLVTLTTVGYGDLLPVTPGGRAIGFVFLLLSTGVLITLFGGVTSFLSGEGFPSLKLILQRKKNWYYFVEVGPEAKTLARQIAAEDSESVIIFGKNKAKKEEYPDYPCIFLNMTPERVIALKKHSGTRCNVFFLKENEIAESTDALKLLSLPVEIYARTDGGSDSISEHLHFFHSYDCCAREYWRKKPLTQKETHVTIIGFGKYGRAILERAILTNIISPDNRVIYHIFGDVGNFIALHPSLSMTFALNYESSDMESLIFHEDDWSTHHKLLQKSDRIIICEDDEQLGWDIYWQMRQYYILDGAVHLRSNSVIPGIFCFGTDEIIFSPEQVLRTELNRIAIAMNEVYKNEHPGAMSWEKLDDSLKLSKIAAADHLKMKVMIILQYKNTFHLTMEDVAKAYLIYLAKCKKNPIFKDQLRQIEHLRWLRFYSYYNWQYGKTRDEKYRLDPRMLPYTYLSEEQKAHCDYAWELMGEITFRDEDY